MSYTLWNYTSDVQFFMWIFEKAKKRKKKSLNNFRIHQCSLSFSRIALANNSHESIVLSFSVCISVEKRKCNFYMRNALSSTYFCIKNFRICFIVTTEKKITIILKHLSFKNSLKSLVYAYRCISIFQ